ncbi:hypothetical protein [Clostridium sp. DJ247]|uniref:hypothetical protein n=1 Tax=Clostridium sp. DJ247 TaxID=2726188 RepID=UPI001626848D|nr:hypothetical protein [Clostridium sp. DJ247]
MEEIKIPLEFYEKFELSVEEAEKLQELSEEMENTKEVDKKTRYIPSFTGSCSDGCSGIELVKRSRIYGFLDDTLCEFLTFIVRIRNRYTHDYYKRDRVEEDIIKCCFSEMIYLEINLKAKEDTWHK